MYNEYELLVKYSDDMEYYEGTFKYRRECRKAGEEHVIKKIPASFSDLPAAELFPVSFRVKKITW